MTELYVSPAGNDDASGMAPSQAVATLQAAQRIARRLVAGGAREITVHVAAGEYFLSEPLVFTEDDGPAEGLVTWLGPDGADAVINAGKRLTGWRQVAEGIYETEVPKRTSFGTLFENGERSPLCRFPAEGYLTTKRRIEVDKHRAFGFDAADLPPIAPEQELSVFMFPGGPDGHWNWSSFTLPVEIDIEGGVATCSDEMAYEIGPGSRYYWRGAREFLTASGQYHLDRKAGIVTYRPRKTPVEEQMIGMPTADRIIVFAGSSETKPARNIRLERLTIRNSDVPQSDRRLTERTGAVHLENAEHIEIRYCRVHSTGLHGVYFTGWAQHSTVYGCHIHDIGHTGVQLDGARGRAVMTCRGNRIENNHIHDTGKNVGHGAGVQISFAGENVVSHNRIHHAPRYAVSLKGPCPESLVYTEVEGVRITPENLYRYHFTRDNIISYNDMYRVNLDTQDTGVYESWGTGTGNRLTANHIHDSDIEFSFGFGIYLDDASSGYLVEGNLVHDLQRSGGGKLWSAIYTKGLSNVFRNNVLVDNPTAQAAVRSHAYATEPCRWLSFSRNIMHRSGAAGIGFVNWDWERMTASDENLFGPGTEYYHWANPNTGKDLARWDAHMKTIYDLRSRQTDPLFMDADARDYRLRFDSPAREIGIEDLDLVAMGLLADYPFADTDAPPQSIYLEARGSISFVRMSAGEKVRTHIHGRDADGIPQNVDPGTLRFTSDDPTIAAVDERGFIEARGKGVTMIRARYGSGDSPATTGIHVIVEK
jgi:hypothetical protein